MKFSDSSKLAIFSLSYLDWDKWIELIKWTLGLFPEHLEQILENNPEINSRNPVSIKWNLKLNNYTNEYNHIALILLALIWETEKKVRIIIDWDNQEIVWFNYEIVNTPN